MTAIDWVVIQTECKYNHTAIFNNLACTLIQAQRDQPENETNCDVEGLAHFPHQVAYWKLMDWWEGQEMEPRSGFCNCCIFLVLYSSLLFLPIVCAPMKNFPNDVIT